MIPPFKNEPFTDFSSERNAALFREALSNVESQLGREYPLVIGGNRFTTGDLLTSPNPSNYDEVVGQVHKATVELADKAIEEATSAFKEWKNVDPVVRARYLLNVASIMRKRKMELA
ncbi:MAG TPA: aldehyde dehydrogenase family protein, partial [Blastocatellia bacterium]|nr:aldehyde dehydrogenase family protein [Blastocatellia bacterium]